jgi:hypothetical protein
MWTPTALGGVATVAGEADDACAPLEAPESGLASELAEAAPAAAGAPVCASAAAPDAWAELSPPAARAPAAAPLEPVSPLRARS